MQKSSFFTLSLSDKKNGGFEVLAEKNSNTVGSNLGINIRDIHRQYIVIVNSVHAHRTARGPLIVF